MPRIIRYISGNAIASPTNAAGMSIISGGNPTLPKIGRALESVRRCAPLICNRNLYGMMPRSRNRDCVPAKSARSATSISGPFNSEIGGKSRWVFMPSTSGYSNV